MAKFYFQLFAFFCFALKWGGNVEASDSGRCEAVMRAITLNSKWSVNLDKKVITWSGMATASTVLKQCDCNPENVDELGDVSMISYTNSTTKEWLFKKLCMKCHGKYIPVTDFTYTVGVWTNGKTHNENGPCSEVEVYRCRCSRPPTVIDPLLKSVNKKVSIYRTDNDFKMDRYA